MSEQTHRLTERISTVCRLTARDVEYLSAYHQPHVKVVPIGQPGQYRLTPAGYVGTIAAPDCRLILRPKLDRANLFLLLDPDQEWEETPAVFGHGSEEILDFLTIRFLALLQKRLSRGLRLGYVERREISPVLRGKLLVREQLRTTLGAPHCFHCQTEELTSEASWNRAVKTTLELLQDSELIDSALRTEIRKYADHLAQIKPLPVVAVRDPNTFRTAPVEYEPILNLCRTLISGLVPQQAGLTAACGSFLLNLEQVFESYVIRGIQRNWGGHGRCHLAVQQSFRVDRPTPGQPPIRFRPDLTIFGFDRPVQVLDAKWKRLYGAVANSKDFYQILAYCTGLGVRRAIIVYPGSVTRSWRYFLKEAAITVELCRLRIQGPRNACQRSLERLRRSVTDALPL